jgi:hypothetical protein
MSYDVGVATKDTEGNLTNVGDTINITSNLRPMMIELMGVTLHEFYGMPVDEVLPAFHLAYTELINNPNHYSRYNAKNGWGTADHLIKFYTQLIDLLEENKQDSYFYVTG